MQILKTKSPHINARREQAAKQQQQVCQIFGWSNDHYAQYQYKKGLVFLWHYYQPGLAEKVESSPTFWAWWRNLWITYDEVFLSERGSYSRDILKNLYIALHNPNEIAQDSFPPRGVWEDIGLRKKRKEVRRG